MKFILVLWFCKLLAVLVNLIDRRRGTNFSGQIAIRLMPDFVRGFKGIDYDKVIFITGTNGKSTTTNMVRGTLVSAGKTVACNVEGANMMPGVATVLIKNSTLGGRLNKEYLVLEVDERSLPGIRRVLPGRHMGITNLEKDQDQRNGDPDFIYSKFESAIGGDMTLYLNNEEPRSSALAEKAGKAVYFSVAENERRFVWHDDYALTLPCPRCSHSIRFGHCNLAGIGAFRCTHCGHASQTEPEVRLTDVDFDAGTFRCGGREFKVGYTDPFYLYNFALVIAVGRACGLSDEELDKAFRGFVNPVSHDQVYRWHGREIRYLQGKQENPEALQSELDVIARDPRRKAVAVGMYKITDFEPHYAGSFYFFDCDFAAIAQGELAACVAFSETICYDLAQRMIYAGVPEEKVTALDTEEPGPVLELLENCDAPVIYILTNTKHFRLINDYILSHGGTRDE